MSSPRVLATAFFGALALSTLPALAQSSQPQHELQFSGVGGSNDSSRTGYLSYRGAVSGSLDDGIFVRVDGMTSRFSYATGSGNRNVARLAVFYALPVTMGKVEVGGGLSYGRERNTPAAPNDFSRVGVFVGAMAEFAPAEGHKVNVLAEFDSPDNQFYGRAFYEASFGQFGIGPVVSGVRSSNYRRTQYGLRANFEMTDNADLTLIATTGRERISSSPSRTLRMMEAGVSLRF